MGIGKYSIPSPQSLIAIFDEAMVSIITISLKHQSLGLGLLTHGVVLCFLTPNPYLPTAALQALVCAQLAQARIAYSKEVRNLVQQCAAHLRAQLIEIGEIALQRLLK